MPATGYELRVQLRELANARRRFGYRRLFVLLRQRGEPSGLNRIYRLYREEGLSVRKRRARRRAVGTRAPILVEARPDARWSLDFVHDQFANGRRFRTLNIVDDVTRECPAAIPDTSIPDGGWRATDGADRSPRQAWHDRLGQRHRVHPQRDADLVGGPPDRLALHCAGKADAERLL
jgi:putative transposase